MDAAYKTAMHAKHRNIARCIFKRQLLNELSAEGRSVKALARFARWHGLLGPGGGFLWMPDPAQKGFVHTKPLSSGPLLRSLYEALSPEEMAELVRLILADDPGLLSRRVNRESLLHLAVLGGAPVEILRILGTTPSVAEFTVGGKTPLHVACIKQLPARSIEFLVDLCPAALTIKDRKGRLPIHWACSPWKGWNDPSATIQILMDANPSTLREKDRRGRLPLDFIFSRQTQPRPAFLNAIVRMIDAYPDPVRDSDRGGSLLLHSACRWLCAWNWAGNPEALRVIQRMIDAYPGALQVKDGEGETPILAALRVGGGGIGWLPLSKACLEGVQLLLDADPSALKVGGRCDMLPLHWAACGPPSVVQRMIDAYPDALLARDSLGKTPLDLARIIPRNDEMVQMLLVATEKAPRMPQGTTVMPSCRPDC